MKCGNAIMGCGREFSELEPDYRCIDCDVNMHRDCLRQHCKDDLAIARAERDAAVQRAELAEADAVGFMRIFEAEFNGDEAYANTIAKSAKDAGRALLDRLHQAEQQVRDREAALGRAHAALRDAQPWVQTLLPSEEEPGSSCRRAKLAIKEVLADVDGQRAAELWRAYEAEHEAAITHGYGVGQVVGISTATKLDAAVATVAALRKDGR